MSCKEVVENLGSGKELSHMGKLKQMAHLFMCGPCSRYWGHMRALRGAVRKYFSDGPSLTDAESKSLEDRIIARLLGKT